MVRESKYSVIIDVEIGEDSIIFDHVNLYKCKIGKRTKIDSFVYVEEGVVIGDDCKIRPFTFIPTGVKIGDRVFIGPNVSFTNDKYPRSKGDWELLEINIEDDVSIGAGSVILPGIRIGRGAMIGAGTVVTVNVESETVVVGNPAKPIKYAY